MSVYSEASAATATMLISEDWSPSSNLFKTRDKGGRAGAEAIELSGVRDNTSPDTEAGERQPLVANSVTFGVTPHKAGNGASSDGSLDASCTIGAQGLMTSFGSVDTNPGNLVCSMPLCV
ncbi:hypothetical protein ElyMa_002629200 [Elysia marginata]|uniref:Uncharacterized protein n=1 Tax=Elysia marginata TaxID=1093978 RepID=A0AAV4H5E0_9GAST|nr:hypothetical protein ElyMa_002629200 [Elysia marginata]